MDKATQKCTSRKNRGTTKIDLTGAENDGTDGTVFQLQIGDIAFNHGEIGVIIDLGLHGLAIELAVRLGARAANGRSLLAVQQPKLDAGGIGDAPHQSVQRVDFADTDSYSGGGYRGSFQFGGGAGYQVTDYFRTDLTMDYLTRGKFDGDGIVGDAKYSALSILANAYVDLGNFKGFTPYVGAGLGGTYVDWSDVSTPAGDRDGAANWRFTYALMAGVSVDLTQSLKLDAGYRYRHVNGGRMFEGDGYSGDGRDRGLNIHDLRIGLRYAFGG